MDVVALVSVVTTGFTASGIAVWSARQTARLAREQRLADSYLEVLRIVEREAQRVEASITGWKTLAEDPYAYGPESKPQSLSRREQERMQEQMRVEMRESAADQATIAAHLAAFGSDNVGKLYLAWRSAITAIDTEKDELNDLCGEYWPGGAATTPPGELKPLLKGLEKLQPKEDAARHALEDAIAAELGHRRQIGHHGLLSLLGAFGWRLPQSMRVGRWRLRLPSDPRKQQHDGRAYHAED